MRKGQKRLVLGRETLRRLDGAQLRGARGASAEGMGLCVSDLPGLCNPSNDSQCESRCLACPSRPPTIEN